MIYKKKDPIPHISLRGQKPFRACFVEDGTNLKKTSYDHLNCYLIPTVWTLHMIKSLPFLSSFILQKMVIEVHCVLATAMKKWQQQACHSHASAISFLSTVNYVQNVLTVIWWWFYINIHWMYLIYTPY